MKYTNIKLFIFFALFLCFCNKNYAQLDLEFHSTELSPILKDISIANDFLEKGFPSLAIHHYSSLISKKNLKLKDKDDILIHLVEAYIQIEDWSAARKNLDLINNKRRPEVFLFQSLFQFKQRNIRLADRLLKNISENQVSDNRKAWFFLLKGLIFDFERQQENAKKAFKKSREYCLNPVQKAQIEVAILQSEFYHTTASDSMAQELKSKLKRFQGQSTENQFLKQYVIILDSLGRKTEAIKEIEDYFSRNSSLKPRNRNSLLMLTALISGPSSPKGQIALRSILSSKVDTDYLRIALTTLTTQAKEEKDLKKLYDFIKNIYLEDLEHPLAEDILFTLAVIDEKFTLLNSAEKYASKFLEAYPGSPLISSVYRLKVSISLQENPPKYRNATQQLNQLLAIEENPQQKLIIKSWIADCYYLDQDYPNASSAYKSLFYETKGNSLAKTSFYQYVKSTLLENKIDSAISFLSEIPYNQIEPETRWKSEWNLILAINQKKGLKEAIKRVRMLNEEITNIPPELALRFMWFETQLTFRDSKDENILLLADEILKITPQLNENRIEESILKSIQSQTLLAKGRSLLRLSKEEEAFETFQQLRAQFTNEESAAISLLVEASHFSSVGLIVEAQGRLIQLVDSYPKSPKAPQALFEAALNAEKRGIKTSYEEAINLLNKLQENYPNSSILFLSKLKQGHLLRRLTKFGEALKIYENILVDFKEHPNINQAEIARIDCLNAMGTRNAQLYEDAIVYLENILGNNIDSKILPELQFKLGNLYLKTDQLLKAEKAYWNAIQLVRDKKSSGPTQNYWISKSLFELANILTEKKAKSEAEQALKIIVENDLPGSFLAIKKIERLGNL